MGKNRSFWVGIVAAAALAVMGCSDDENGGTAGNGGTGGTGGSGGAGEMMGFVTVAHLAPGLPTQATPTLTSTLTTQRCRPS